MTTTRAVAGVYVGVDTGLRGKGREQRVVYHCSSWTEGELITVEGMCFESAVQFCSVADRIVVEMPNPAGGVYGKQDAGAICRQARVLKTIQGATRLAAHLSGMGLSVHEMSVHQIRKLAGCDVATHRKNPLSGEVENVKADPQVKRWLATVELALHRRWPAERIRAALRGGKLNPGPLGTPDLRDAYAACVAAERHAAITAQGAAARPQGE